MKVEILITENCSLAEGWGEHHKTQHLTFSQNWCSLEELLERFY